MRGDHGNQSYLARLDDVRERGQYEAPLEHEIFAGIQGRHIRGFKSIQLLRRAVGHEVEFVTNMKFDSLDAVREFVARKRARL